MQGELGAAEGALREWGALLAGVRAESGRDRLGGAALANLLLGARRLLLGDTLAAELPCLTSVTEKEEGEEWEKEKEEEEEKEKEGEGEGEGEEEKGEEEEKERVEMGLS